jgi:hypothetical protein
MAKKYHLQKRGLKAVCGRTVHGDNQYYPFCHPSSWPGLNRDSKCQVCDKYYVREYGE